MNLFHTTPDSFFCFDEGASGTGVTAPAGGASSAAAPASAGGSAEPSGGASAGAGGGTAEPASPEGMVDSDPFSGMDDDFDSIDLGAATEPDADDQPPATPPAPVVPPAATAAPASPPVVPPAAAVSPPAANDPSSRSPLEQAIDGFSTNEKALGQWAGANLFKLSPEDTEALTTNAEELIPQLMGRAYVQTLIAAGNLIRNFVPAIIDQRVEAVSGAKSRATEALNEFYAANTHLNSKDHQPVVDKWVKVFRAANPKASRTDAIAFVGRAVSVELGLTPGAPQAVRAQPFAPARPGGRPPTQQVVDDPYSGLDQDFDL